MTKKRTYPFTAYTLTHSMAKVVEVKLIRKPWWAADCHEGDSGKVYGDADLHPTPDAAIAAGRAKLDEQRAKLAKQLVNLEKRAANLDKVGVKL